MNIAAANFRTFDSQTFVFFYCSNHLSSKIHCSNTTGRSQSTRYSECPAILITVIRDHRSDATMICYTGNNCIVAHFTRRMFHKNQCLKFRLLITRLTSSAQIDERQISNATMSCYNGMTSKMKNTKVLLFWSTIFF